MFRAQSISPSVQHAPGMTDVDVVMVGSALPSLESHQARKALRGHDAVKRQWAILADIKAMKAMKK